MDTLQDLMHDLNKVHAAPRKIDNTVGAIEVTKNPSKEYVWPTLRDWEPVIGAGIILIEAAGAVGKSAAAVALASHLRWPLVNAARAQVGSYSLSGLIHDAFGFESPFLADVSAGRAGIIVDALDEAHLRAGTANFQAFLHNVIRLAGSTRHSASVILFSRPDTAVLIREYFDNENTLLTNAAIDFFDFDQAGQFIDLYMARRDRESPGQNYAVSVQHPAPFATLRNQRMMEIASALLTDNILDLRARWAEVRTFLGYAPVLAVLGEYLAVPNPSKYKATFDTARPTEILLKIIQNLLLREQEKFQDQMSSKLRADLPAADDWDGFDQIYSPAEQGLRLVRQALKLEFAVPVPASLPSSLRQNYDRSANQFIADHPFLAGRNAVNVVFEDYINAKASVDQGCLTALTPDPRQAKKNIGPFYYQFVHEFGKTSVGHDSVISEDLVPLIIESFTQVIAGNTGYLVYHQYDDQAQLALTHLGAMASLDRLLEFEVTDLTGLLELPQRLSRSIVLTDSGVRISGEFERFILGPFTRLRASEIYVETDHISVDYTRDLPTPTAVVRAERIHVQRRLRVDCPDHEAFQVLGSHKHIPAFAPYMDESADGHGFAELGDYLVLRSILRRFSQGAGHAPSVYYDLMEQRVVKGNVARRRYLNRLQELGIITHSGNHYYLNTDKLSRYGINLQSIISGNPTEMTTSLIKILNDGGS